MTTTLDELQGAPPARLDVDVCRAVSGQPTLRAAGDDSDSPGTLVGEFSVFNEWYEIDSYWEGQFLERIAPGAFKRTINNRSGETPVRCLLEHGFDPTVGDKPLGVPTILEERATGPYAETPLFDTSYNRDLAPALAAGAYGQSFRFRPLRDEWVEEPGISDHNPKGLPERTITEVRLIEYGPTIFPASPATNDTTGLRVASTTDTFYERLQRRDPARYDGALQSVRSARSVPAPAPGSTEATPAPEATPPADPAPASAASGTSSTPDDTSSTEDSPTAHSKDSDATGAHSTDSPDTHSTDTSSTTNPQRKSTDMDETMTVEERTARISEIKVRLSEIDADNAGAAMTDETRKEWDGLFAEMGQHEEAIDDVTARRAQLDAIADNPDATESGDTTSTAARTAAAARGRSSRPGAPGTTRRPDNIYDLSAIRQQARSIDDMPRLLKENALRAVEAGNFPGVEDRQAAQTHVEKLLRSIDDKEGTLARRILITGSPTYDRAFGKAAMAASTAGLSAEEQRALSLGVDSEGGFAVPFDLDPTVILTSGGVIDPIREISRVETITGKQWQGITSAGVTASRRAEKAQTTDGAPAMGQPTCETSRVDAFVPFSVEIEQDWSRMKNEITMLLTEAKADEEADSFINGDGSRNGGTGEEPDGVLATLAGGSHVITVTANAFADDDLYAVQEALPPRFRKNATWLAELSFFNATRQLGANSDGGNLWVRLGDGLPPSLIGHPKAEASEMPSFALADNAPLAILGDFKKFLIADRAGMNVELIANLMGANQRPTGMRGLFVWWRNGSKILTPNAFRLLKVNPGA